MAQTLAAVVLAALLFALFAISRAAERTRPCKGRAAWGKERCGTCPLRGEASDELGPCPGPEGFDDR